MPIEVTEFVTPPAIYGALLPVAPLPEIDAHAVTAGDPAIQLSDRTQLVTILPDADCRVRVRSTEAEAEDAGETNVLCKADQPRDFKVMPGHWLAIVAA